MKLQKLIIAFCLVTLLAPTTNAQEEYRGMVWFWFDGAKECSANLDSATKGRDQAVRDLSQKISEENAVKIRVYIRRAESAQSEVMLARACAADYSRNLEKVAGRAYENEDSSIGNIAGKMTEAEYDNAMSLVKSLRDKLEKPGLGEGQRKIMDNARSILDRP